MEIVHDDARPRALHARGGQGARTSRRCCSTGSSTTPSRSTSTAIVRRRARGDRRHHGAHRGGRRALGRLGVFAAAVLAAAGAASTTMREQTAQMARELKVDRPDERAVRDPKQDGQATIYVLEVNPRASRTVPFVSKATGVPLAKIAARCMVGKTLDQLGVTKRDHAAVLLGQGGGVPVQQVPGRRHAARARDALDRRGDGRGHDLRRSAAQVAAGAGTSPAARARSSSASRTPTSRVDRGGAPAARPRLRAGRHPGTAPAIERPASR